MELEGGLQPAAQVRAAGTLNKHTLIDQLKLHAPAQGS